jgi:hypothetical protein
MKCEARQGQGKDKYVKIIRDKEDLNDDDNTL